MSEVKIFELSYEKKLREKAENASDKNPFVCILLALFHLHYFYVGRFGRGILCLLTMNFFFIGTITDLLLIAVGRFKDGDGRYVTIHRVAERMLKK